MNWMTNIGLTEKLSWICHDSNYSEALFGYIGKCLMLINHIVKESDIS